MTATSELCTAMVAAYRGGPVLTIDPDCETPGAAHWTPEDGATLPRARVWGGNSTGAALADPNASRAILARLSPGLVVVEAPLASGGQWSAYMHPQNIVRGGWVWLCALEGVPCVLLPPGIWQYPICRNTPGPRKPTYKRHARELLGVKSINEDAAAALGILEFALWALGHELPADLSVGEA